MKKGFNSGLSAMITSQEKVFRSNYSKNHRSFAIMSAIWQDFGLDAKHIREEIK